MDQVDHLGRYGEENFPHARRGNRSSLAVELDGRLERKTRWGNRAYNVDAKVWIISVVHS